MYSGKFIVVFVGAFVALAAAVPADRLKRSPQIPGMPDGMPMPPMPMLNRLVRQIPDGPPPPPGFMVAASEYASEMGLSRIARQAPAPPAPPAARIARSAPFHSESSKQVAQEVIYTNVVSVEREKRSPTGKKSSGKSSSHKKG